MAPIFHLRLDAFVASQFTTPPKSSPSFWSVPSSVKVSRFLSEFWTSDAFSSFFSRVGNACFFGGGA